MLHPSYTDLIEAVNSGVEPGEQPVVQSRYSIVIAAAKRARQLIAGADPLVAGAARKKPLSTAVQELYEQKVTILPEEEELPEEASLTENDEAECGAKDAAEEAERKNKRNKGGRTALGIYCWLPLFFKRKEKLE